MPGAPAVPTLGLLIALPPDRPAFQRAMALARKAIDQNVAVYAYLLDDAVSATNHPVLNALIGKGLHASACAYAADRRGLELRRDFIHGGLGLLADIVRGVDRFVGVGPGDSPAEELDAAAGGAFGAPSAPKGGARRRVFILAAQDPRTSHTVAEAARVAGGLAATDQFEVTLGLCGPAVAALRETPEPHVDPEILAAGLELLRAAHGRLAIAAHPPGTSPPGASPRAEGDAELADEMSRAFACVRF